MDIYLFTFDRKEVIKLPVIPNEITVNSPQKNEVFETVQMGELKLIGLKGLKSLNIDSFFPSKDYPFLKDRTYKGFEYINIIEKWRDTRLPIRLLITATNINIPVAIDNFDYGIKDGTMDIYYALALTEFKVV